MGLKVGVENIARNATNAYVGVIEMTNLCPKINGATNFTIRSNSGTATGESSTVHTKYSQQSLKLNITDTNTAEVYASSSTSLPLNPEHIYYARIEAYQETKFGAVELYFPIAEPQMFDLATGDVGKWNMYSVVKERSSFTAGNYTFRLDFNRERSTETAGSVWYDGWMIIDLTEAFGSGNEPTKEWCDANIPYFEGTTVVRNYNVVGIARKIKQICIGDENGIARLVYPTGEEQNGVFVIVGDDGVSYWSKDGKTWTACTGLDSSKEYSPIAYGNGIFVTHGYKNSGIYISEDGKTWINSKKYLGSYTWNKGVYGNSMFIFVGNEVVAKITRNSKDTLNVSSSEINSVYYYRDVAYGMGKFVAVGSNDGKSLISYSTDGTTWTHVQSPYTNQDLFAVAYGAGKFVALHSTGAMIYSTDGVTWTSGDSVDLGWGAIVYANGVFVMSGREDGDLAFYRSTDGVTWTRSLLVTSESGPSSSSAGIAYGNGMFVTYGQQNVWWSKDGITWNSQTVSFNTSQVNKIATNYSNKTIFADGFFPKFTNTSNSDPFTFTDERGAWTASVSGTGSGSSVGAAYAFDKIENTYWYSPSLGSSSTSAWLRIDCPIAIKPSLFKVHYNALSNSSSYPATIQGLNASTGAWDNIATLVGGYTEKTEYVATTTENFYQSFRLNVYRYSSGYKNIRIFEFDIVEGKIK